MNGVAGFRRRGGVRKDTIASHHVVTSPPRNSPFPTRMMPCLPTGATTARHPAPNSAAAGQHRQRMAPPPQRAPRGMGKQPIFIRKNKMLPLIRAKTFPQPQPGPQPRGTFLAGQDNLMGKGLHTAVLPGLTAPCRGGPDCGSASAPAPRTAGSPHKGCRRELTTTAADLTIAGRRFFLLLLFLFFVRAVPLRRQTSTHILYFVFYLFAHYMSMARCAQWV